MRKLPLKRIKGVPFQYKKTWYYKFNKLNGFGRQLRSINRDGVTVGNRKSLHNSMARYTAHRRWMQHLRFNRNNNIAGGMLGLNRLNRIPTDVLRNIATFL